MMSQVKPIADHIGATRIGRFLFAPLVSIALGFTPFTADDAFADENSPERRIGACTGAYPGWLRGVVDGYYDVRRSPVEDASLILPLIPSPEWLSKGDQRLGFGDGLQEGFKLGVAYGVELANAARTPNPPTDKLAELTAQFQSYVQAHCTEPATGHDWSEITSAQGTWTLTSLNEAQIAMHFASSANQMAIAAENAARYAQDAKARGDWSALRAFQDAARLHSQTAEEFARLAEGQLAKGREEAIQPIIDAQKAAERARKAADSIDG